MPRKDNTNSPKTITTDANLVRTNSPDTTPSDADLVSKSVGISYIGSYKEESSSVENPIDEATKGNICSSKKERVEEYNAIVSRDGLGQVVEIHGHKETGTIMAKFENQDGSLARETVTSAPTPPDVDREDYYDDFVHLFGIRDESYIPPASYPSVSEQVTSTEAVSAQERDESSTALGKRKLEDSDQETNKRSKKDGDDDNEGSGSATSGSSGNDTSGPTNSAGPSNFRSIFDQTVIILITITTSILDAVNEILTLM